MHTRVRAAQAVPSPTELRRARALLCPGAPELLPTRRGPQVGGEFLSRFYPVKLVLIPSPSW